MCCARLAEYTGCKKIAICAPSQNFVGLYLRNKVCIDNRKNLLNSNISSTCPHNIVKFGLHRRSVREFGHPSKFQRVSHLGIVTAPTSLSGGQLNFARCLAVLVHYIYVIGGSCPLVQFCYVLWSKGHQPNFAAFSRGRHLYSAVRPSRWDRPTL